jgi:hypothetical protein
MKVTEAVPGEMLAPVRAALRYSEVLECDGVTAHGPVFVEEAAPFETPSQAGSLNSLIAKE